jgi:WD40 repeat protein
MQNFKDFKRSGHWRSSDILFSIAQVPGSQRVLVGSSDFGVHELDFAAEELKPAALEGEGHTSYVTGLALAGETLVSGSYDGRLIFWDLQARRQKRAVAAHEKWIRRVIASPDGSRIYSVADDMQCKVWDAASGDPVTVLSDHAPLTPQNYPSMLFAVAVSADGKLLATGDKVGQVSLWDTQSFEKIAEVQAPGLYTWDPKQRRHSIGGIRSLAFSPDATKLAVGGIGKIGNVDHLEGPARLEIFALPSGDKLHELEDSTRKGLIEKIIWSADGSRVLTLGGDHKGFITLYDAGSGELLHQDGNDGHIHDAAADQSQQNLYIAAHHSIERWTFPAPEAG